MLHTEKTQYQKHIDSTCEALECHLPESIRPLLREHLERVAILAKWEGEKVERQREREAARYNGWSNRETWLVPLWWEGCPIESIEADTREEAVEQLAEQLEELFDDLQDQHNIPACSMLADLLGGATARINWREIAEHWVDDIELTLTGEEETEEEGD